MLVNINPAYRPRRARIRAEQGRVQGADHRAPIQDQRVRRDAARTRAGDRRELARPSQVKKISRADDTDPHRRRHRSGHASALTMNLPPRRCRRSHAAHRALGTSCSSTTRSTSSSPAAPPAAPKGATLTHHNILNNGYFIGEAMRLTERDRVCIPGAALSLLRHGDGQSRLPDARRDHGLSRRRLSIRWRRWRPSRRSAAPRSTACRPCSSPSSDHPEFKRFDLEPAHRHHGGLALPDRGDEGACIERDAHVARSRSPTA